MNLIFLVPKDLYGGKMSRVRFDEVDALVKADPPMTVVTTGPGWPDWPQGLQPGDYIQQRYDFFKSNQQEIPHLVLSYKVEGLQKSPIPVAMIFHETYNWSQVLREIEDTGATLIIFTYQNDLERYRPAIEQMNAKDGKERVLVSIPHGADPAIYRDYATETLMGRRVTDPMLSLEHYQSPFDPGYKDTDVLIVGNQAREFYPFRHRLMRLALRELKKRGYNVVHAQHPGFTLPARVGTYVGDDYARLLNRSKLVLTCTGRHHYAFNKLVEIPLCWSLPVSDLPAERQKFFSQTMLNVEMWHTDREILTKIEDVLDDDETLVRLTTIAHDKVQQRLTLPHWAERFIFYARRHVWGEAPEPPTAPVGEEDM
jgi:hypothetical protein